MPREVDLAQNSLSLGCVVLPAVVVVGGSFEVGDLALRVLERCLSSLT